ncbi:MAG: NAD(P)H-hydrate dehydratase [Spirochaetes bacterium]|nr:NAD(P)H-hydrate dehydratase [Spirochaetota bacterium]
MWQEPVVTCKEALELDRHVQTEYRLPAAILMENAGRSAAEHLVANFEGPWVIVAGKGNNGGDALVVARHLLLKGEKHITILLVQQDLGELPALHLSVLKKEGCRVIQFPTEIAAARQAIKDANTLVDGIFGIGLRGAIRGEARELINLLNQSGKRIVSIDVPSGLGDEYCPGYPVVQAEETLSFEVLKLCLFMPEARTHCGRIYRLSAGFPDTSLSILDGRIQRIHPTGISQLIRYPDPWAYKNKRGHVAVFASSVGTTGAGLLAAEAVLRSGAGLVSLFADPAVYPLLASQIRSLMVKPMPTVFSDSWEKGFSSLLVGPGWGRGEERIPYLRRLLSYRPGGVIDADGIYVLKALLDETVDLSGWILTPHPGEFCVLTGCSKEEFEVNPLPKAQEFIAKYRCILVLKGHVTYIIAPDGQIRIFDGMNPLLGTGGTGDVLAGLITGIRAQGIDPFSAATLGVLLLSEAACEAKRIYGYFLSQDLLPFLSKVVLSYAEQSRNFR